MPLNIDFLQILLHMFNFLILAGGLTFLLFKPICKFLDERSQKIEDEIRSAQEAAEQNEKTKEEYEQKLSQTKTEIAAIRADAEKQAADASKATIAAAKERADAIIAAAEQEAENRREHILDAAQAEISELVITATQKLLSDTVTPERNSALYDEFIRKAEQSVADKRTKK